MKMRRGFTLVELLVVISIIGILVALLLPAVQSARESGRRTQCMNNLKQLTTAALAHESAHQFYPTGGWAWYWSGDPDRGNGQRQPGGWSFNILPFLGEQPLHDNGIGLSPTSTAKKNALSLTAATPLNAFYCPTRRPARAYPNQLSSSFQTCNTNGNVTMSARTDYAANAGTYFNSKTTGASIWWNLPDSGDPTFTDAINPPYQFPDTSGFDGIMFPVSTITNADITDGTTYTYMFGEKSLDPQHYTDGLQGQDNNPLYAGFDWDWSRWGALSGTTSTPYPPMRDRVGNDLQYSYGSAHIDGLNMFTCDSSGHWTSYSIDPTLFAYMCSRNEKTGNSYAVNATKLGW
jgi:prepilin-type N-terminal cleavage/methylation domain-containing protein